MDKPQFKLSEEELARHKEEHELAKYYEEHMDDDSIWSKKARTIRSRRGQGPSTIFSLRLTGEELTRIAQASFARGINPSEFIRTAAMKALEELEEPDKRDKRRSEAVDEVKEKVKELTAAVGKL